MTGSSHARPVDPTQVITRDVFAHRVELRSRAVKLPGRRLARPGSLRQQVRDLELFDVRVHQQLGPSGGLGPALGQAERVRQEDLQWAQVVLAPPVSGQRVGDL